MACACPPVPGARHPRLPHPARRPAAGAVLQRVLDGRRLVRGAQPHRIDGRPLLRAGRAGRPDAGVHPGQWGVRRPAAAAVGDHRRERRRHRRRGHVRPAGADRTSGAVGDDLPGGAQRSRGGHVLPRLAGAAPPDRAGRAAAGGQLDQQAGDEHRADDRRGVGRPHGRGARPRVGADLVRDRHDGHDSAAAVAQGEREPAARHGQGRGDDHRTARGVDRVPQPYLAVGDRDPVRPGHDGVQRRVPGARPGGGQNAPRRSGRMGGDHGRRRARPGGRRPGVAAVHAAQADAVRGRVGRRRRPHAARARAGPAAAGDLPVRVRPGDPHRGDDGAVDGADGHPHPLGQAGPGLVLRRARLDVGDAARRLAGRPAGCRDRRVHHAVRRGRGDRGRLGADADPARDLDDPGRRHRGGWQRAWRHAPRRHRSGRCRDRRPRARPRGARRFERDGPRDPIR